MSATSSAGHKVAAFQAQRLVLGLEFRGAGSSSRQTVDETLPLRQLVVELVQVRVRRAPVDLWKAEVQIPEGAGHGDVRQAHVDA